MSWARELFHHPQTPLTSFLSRHGADILGKVPGPVVVLADETSGETVAAWQKAAPGRVRVIALATMALSAEPDPLATPRRNTSAPSQPEPETETEPLSSAADDVRDASKICEEIGAIAVLVDATTAPALQRVLNWEWLFFHVAERGAYVAPEGPVEPAWVGSLDLAGGKHKSDRELSELRVSLGEQRLVSDGFVVMTKTLEHLFKIPEARAGHLLASRLPDLDVTSLERLDGGRFDSPLRVRQHGVEQDLPSTKINYSPAEVRHYRGPVGIGPLMLTVAGGSVLPPSFRHPWVKNVKNEALRNINWEFAILPEGALDWNDLPGTYYDLNSSIPGHFGHVMTESVAKLWGWAEAKRRIPDLKAFYRIPGDDYDPIVEKALFTAHGIDADDIHWESRDVVVDSYVSSTVLWQNSPSYQFHPALRATWSGLRAALVTADPSRPDKVFVSRRFSTENRLCRNADEVENTFASAGFTIVHPEKLEFDEQAAIFGSARVVAGFAGSGMFNMLFSERLERVVVLSHDSYWARNEFLFAASSAECIDYFWSAADIQHPGAFSTTAFHSSWEFDFAQNGAALQSVLDEIGS